MKNYFISLCLLLSLSATSVWATSVLPLSLEQLSTRATLIFYAEVISNETKKDEKSGYIATFTKFKIIDLIKGDASTTHTIKQLGGYDPNAKTKLHIQGIPTFRVGDKHVVFLPTKSTLGFCSPLGLSQGSYYVTNHKGEATISNGRNLTEPAATTNNTIRVPLAISASRPSQSRLVDFVNTVRSYNIP